MGQFKDSWNFGVGFFYYGKEEFNILDNDYVQVIGVELKDDGSGYKFHPKKEYDFR